MKKSLVSGLESDAAKEVELAFKSSPTLRRRLSKLLEDEKTSRIDSNLSQTKYDCPNWAYKQAHNQGYAEGIKYALSLLE